MFFQRCQSIHAALNDYVKTSGGLLVVADYDESHYHDTLFTEFGIVFNERMEKSVVKRKSEYLAGRMSAKLALQELGAQLDAIGTDMDAVDTDLEKFDIVSDKNRCPLWPKGFVGSISHSNAIATTLLYPSGRAESIGIDVEKCVDDTTCGNIKRLIIDENEQALLKSQNEDFNTLFTYIFSAKESIFKCLYPSVGRYFDFEAAKLSEITIQDISTKGGRAVFVLVENLTETFSSGCQVVVDIFPLHEKGSSESNMVASICRLV